MSRLAGVPKHNEVEALRIAGRGDTARGVKDSLKQAVIDPIRQEMPGHPATTGEFAESRVHQRTLFL